MNKNYYVYMLTNNNHSTLYVGVTNDLARRVYEHRQGAVAGFTKRYNVHKLVYYETYHDIGLAIEREKRLKKWHRSWKEDLIKTVNLNWSDLYDDLNR